MIMIMLITIINIFYWNVLEYKVDTMDINDYDY